MYIFNHFIIDDYLFLYSFRAIGHNLIKISKLLKNKNIIDLDKLETFLVKCEIFIKTLRAHNECKKNTIMADVLNKIDENAEELDRGLALTKSSISVVDHYRRNLKNHFLLLEHMKDAKTKKKSNIYIENIQMQIDKLEKVVYILIVCF